MATWTGSKYYDTAVSEYNKKAKNDLNQQIAQTNADYNGQLQSAYIQRLQEQKKLNQNLSGAGIRGGATETANLALANTYNANRNAIETNRNTAITGLNTSYNDNVFNYNQMMNTAKAEYQQNQLANYYNALYNKSYSVSDLKKSLKKATSNEQIMAINQMIAYLREHKKGY